MKKIFVVMILLLSLLFIFTETVNASLVIEEKYVYDDINGNYYVRDLSLFGNLTYIDQLTKIENLKNDAYFGPNFSGWHMASLSEMQALYSYSDSAIWSAFQRWPGSTILHGRIDQLWAQGVHLRAGIFNVGGDLFRLSLPGNSAFASYIDPSLGAWVVTKTYTPVVPIPPSIIFLGSGLIGILGIRYRCRK